MADQTTTIIKGWKMTPLGEMGVAITGKTPSKDNPSDWGDFLDFITPTDIVSDSKYLNNVARKLSEDGANRFKKMIIPPKSVVVTCIGSDMGKVVMNRNEALTNQQINSIKINSKNDKDYIFYLLKNSYTILRNIAVGGSTMPILNKTTFESLEFLTAPLTEQRAIAAVLSSLDDKIELLREQNKTLEATAQAIFKEWFVNFNLPAVVLTKAGFPDGKIKMIDSELGKIPEGWRVGNLTELFDFIKGIEPGSHNYSVKKLSEDYLPFYRVQDTLNYNKTPNVFVDKRILNGKIFKKDDILISLDGTIGRIFIGASGGYSSGIRKVVGKESFISKFLIFCFLKSDKFQGELNSFAGAETTIKHAGGAIEHIKFVFEKSICEEFGKITNPLFQKMVFNNFQIQTLSTLRDLLLPKLMKGELRVKI